RAAVLGLDLGVEREEGVHRGGERVERDALDAVAGDLHEPDRPSSFVNLADDAFARVDGGVGHAEAGDVDDGKWREPVPHGGGSHGLDTPSGPCQPTVAAGTGSPSRQTRMSSSGMSGVGMMVVNITCSGNRNV